MTDVRDAETPLLPSPDDVGKAEARARGGVLDEWRDTWFGILILMVVAAVLGALLSRLWPGGEGGMLGPSAELSEKVEALEARVLQLANTQPGPPEQEMAAIRNRLSVIEERIRVAEVVLPSVPGATTDGATALRGTDGAPTNPVGEAAGVTNLETAIKAYESLQARLAALEIAAKMAQAAPGVTSGTGGAAAAALAQAEIQPIKDGLAQTSLAMTALSARIDDLQAKIAAAPDPTPLVAAVKSEVDAVSGRVATIEQADLAGSARRAALGAAVASLTRAAQGAQPFKSELDVVVGLAADDVSANELAPYAERGVQTLSGLAAAFVPRAEAALRAERDANAGEGIGRLWSGVTSIVSVRATGTPNGSDTASILARSETRLKSGDLRAAATEIGKLQGVARAAMAPWLEQANARIKLDAALSSLNTRVVKSLTQTAIP